MTTSTRGRARVLAVAAAVLLLLAGCGDDGTATPPAGNGTDGATSPATGATEEPTATTTGHVYYLVDTRTGFRLARELRDLEGDPGVAAVEAMVDGAEDPDYATPWNPGTEVLSVAQDGGVIEVDLSNEARTANAGSEVAALMVQQLTWTVTDALGAPSGAVQLLIEGEPAGELWGILSWDEPVTRADPVDVRTFVQIDTPREGATTSSPLTVEGEANVFEANLPWQVLDETGAVVEEGFTMTAEGMTFAPYSFSVDLAPGTYTVRIVEDDPSGGEGGTPMEDTRTVTVE